MHADSRKSQAGKAGKVLVVLLPLPLRMMIAGDAPLLVLLQSRIQSAPAPLSSPIAIPAASGWLLQRPHFPISSPSASSLQPQPSVTEIAFRLLYPLSTLLGS
jgi:hypothetical protein